LLGQQIAPQTISLAQVEQNERLRRGLYRQYSEQQSPFFRQEESSGRHRAASAGLAATPAAAPATAPASLRRTDLRVRGPANARVKESKRFESISSL
jgi:hypothetical protein